MICPLNVDDTWGVESKSGGEKTILDLADIETDSLIMEMEDNWEYTGDILPSDGKNSINIKERVERGPRAVTNICHSSKISASDDIYED